MAKRMEKIKEYREMKLENLKHILEEKRKNVREMRFNMVSGQMKKVDDISETKKDIARILTIIKQKNN